MIVCAEILIGIPSFFPKNVVNKIASMLPQRLILLVDNKYHWWRTKWLSKKRADECFTLWWEIAEQYPDDFMQANYEFTKILNEQGLLR